MIFKQNYDILDDAQSIFFSRELEYIYAETYDVMYPDLNALMIFPVSAAAPEWTETITYRSYDKTGVAIIINGYGTDLPRVDISGKEYSIMVKEIGDAYGFSVKEIGAANQAGKPLDRMKGEAARRAIDQKINDIAFNGDSESGLEGVLSNANVPDYTIPNGAGGTPEWSTKTADEILADLNAVVNKIVSDTNEVERPDSVALPTNEYQLIHQTPRSTQSDTTIAEFFLKNNPYIKNIYSVHELATAGAGGSALMLVYKKDPKKFTIEIPMPFKQLPPQEKGLEIEIPCMARTGGAKIQYPLSLCKADNI